MARIDKYQPVAGGFRAPLNAAYTGAVAAIGVGLNSSGRVVAGAGVTGIIGVVVSPYDKAAGDIIDVMTAGEMVEFGGVAGTTYTANTTTGAITSGAASATQTRVGCTVEADRLVVRTAGAAGILATAVVGDQTAIVHLTAAFGTPDNTVADVTGVFSQTILNNNFADLAAKVNAILTTLESAGLLTP